MLVLMDACCVDSEKWIRDKAARRKSRVAEIDMDDEEGDEREYDVAAQSAKATVGIEWPYHAI
jgi:hypothetical protein